jgi:hypothetical protein
VRGDVNHIFVMGNYQPTSVTYGTANPAITTNIYGNGLVTGETRFYTDAASPTAAVIPQNVNNPAYPIYCTGPTTISPIAPSTLTIMPLAITVTAVNSTKVYDSTTSAQVGVIPTLSPSIPPYGDTLTLAETYDNPNVGTTQWMTPSIGGGPLPVTLFRERRGYLRRLLNRCSKPCRVAKRAAIIWAVR